MIYTFIVHNNANFSMNSIPLVPRSPHSEDYCSIDENIVENSSHTNFVLNNDLTVMLLRGEANVST